MANPPIGSLVYNSLPPSLQLEIRKAAKKHSSEEIRKKVDPLNMKAAKVSAVSDEIKKISDKSISRLTGDATILGNIQKSLITTSVEITGLENQLARMAKDLQKAEKSGDAKKQAGIEKKMATPAKALAQKLRYGSSLVHDVEAKTKELDGNIRSYLAQMKGLFGKL